MPLPRLIARTNQYWINPVARRIGPRLPPMMVVHHFGRRSGRAYTTPIWAFRTPEGFLIVLTYGPGTDWLRNLQATESVTAAARRRIWRLSEPRVVHSHPDQHPLPWLVRRVITAMGIRDFLYLKADPE